MREYDTFGRTQKAISDLKTSSLDSILEEHKIEKKGTNLYTVEKNGLKYTGPLARIMEIACEDASWPAEPMGGPDHKKIERFP